MKYLLLLLFLAACMNLHGQEIQSSTHCLHKPNLSEELLYPVKQDTLNFLSFYKHHQDEGFASVFLYEYTAITRGLADTALFDPKHYHQFDAIKSDYRHLLAFSPLVIDGTVIQTIYDTIFLQASKRKSLIYHTNILIRINDVIKSKYKVNVGDTVLVKIMHYGIIKDSNGRVGYSSGEDRQFQNNRSYLFCLDKYHYMFVIYLMKHGGESGKYCQEEYCPSAFELSLESFKISVDYEEHKIDKNTILQFLDRQR
ncbi:MAG: hypothetical protein H0X33_02440 [Taibaiella sp.]|nr:hypothetical protein [Taibaiella sp.]